MYNFVHKPTSTCIIKKGYSGQESVNFSTDVHNQHLKGKVHHLSSWRGPRQGEQPHNYLKFYFSLTSFKDVIFPWLEVKFSAFSQALKWFIFPWISVPALWQLCLKLSWWKRNSISNSLLLTIKTKHRSHPSVSLFDCLVRRRNVQNTCWC